MTPAPSPWELSTAGRYAEAVEAYSRELVADDTPHVRRARGAALLLAGRAAEAVSDFRLAINCTPSNLRGDGDYLRLGVCHWHLGHTSEAVTCWREALTTPYTDAAGGVTRLLFFLYAGVRLNDERLTAEAIRLLNDRRATHLLDVIFRRPQTDGQRHEAFVHPGLAAWPGAIVPFLIGKMSVEGLDSSAASSPVEVLRLRHGCQADVAVAVRALREGNPDLFQDRMTRAAACTRYGPLEEEFFLARWEVENGFPTLNRGTPSLFE